jgi:hypothetical protein
MLAKENGMNQVNKLLLLISLVVFAMVGIQGRSWAADSGQQKTVLLRFHSFSMNPGEKVVGTIVTVSQGEIVHVSTPGGWSRQFTRLPDKRHSVHCISQHISYGINASGRMPVFTIADKSGSSGAMRIEASVEIESGDGKRYTRQMMDSELSVQ